MGHLLNLHIELYCFPIMMMKSNVLPVLTFVLICLSRSRRCWAGTATTSQTSPPILNERRAATRVVDFSYVRWTLKVFKISKATTTSPLTTSGGRQPQLLTIVTPAVRWKCVRSPRQQQPELLTIAMPAVRWKCVRSPRQQQPELLTTVMPAVRWK